MAVIQSVASLWIGKPLSNYEKVSLQSFVARGFNVSLYAYDSQMVVPEGVTLLDAREILEESQIFENPLYRGSWATFADVFRYQLLAKTSNIWIDTDVIALRNSLPSENGYTFGWQPGNTVGIGVLGAPRESRLVEILTEHVAQIETHALPWGEIGPKLFTEKVQELKMEQDVQSVNAFYPVPWQESWRFFDSRETESILSEVRDSFALHWWNEIVRIAPKNIKRLAPPKGSFMRLVFEDLDYDLSKLPTLDSNWARENWKGNTHRRESRHQRIKNWARRALGRM